MVREEVPGGRALRKWKGAVRGRSYVDLADRLGVTTQSLYEWRYGISRPEKAHRVLLEAATGIGADIWSTAAERRHEAKLARRLAAIQTKGEPDVHEAKVTRRGGGRKVNTRSGGARACGAGEA